MVVLNQLQIIDDPEKFEEVRNSMKLAGTHTHIVKVTATEKEDEKARIRAAMMAKSELYVQIKENASALVKVVLIGPAESEMVVREKMKIFSITNLVMKLNKAKITFAEVELQMKVDVEYYEPNRMYEDSK